MRMNNFSHNVISIISCDDSDSGIMIMIMTMIMKNT